MVYEEKTLPSAWSIFVHSRPDHEGIYDTVTEHGIQRAEGDRTKGERYEREDCRESETACAPGHDFRADD